MSKYQLSVQIIRNRGYTLLSKNRLALVTKAGLAGAAVVAAVLGAALPASAAESAAGVTVTPSTGLSDGQAVTVAASGFGADETVYVTECAGDPAAGTLVCDVAGITQFTTDATGAGSTTTAAKKTFDGLDQTGNPVTVDCGTVDGGCLIGVSNEAQDRATAAISFA
jgi:hypothetical protein